MEFKKKGNQKQFSFNAEVANHVEAATRKIQKLSPTEEKEKKIDDALEGLTKGTEAITERQKHILMGDQSIHHWRVVEAYKRALLMGSDEEEKVAEQEVLQGKQRANSLPRPRMMTPQPPSVQMTPQWHSMPPPRAQIPMGRSPPPPPDVQQTSGAMFPFPVWDDGAPEMALPEAKSLTVSFPLSSQ